MFTLGIALLTWSTIYGLENFDAWDGSELSCIAVANIAAGKFFIFVHCFARQSLTTVANEHHIIAIWFWDFNLDAMRCVGVIDLLSRSMSPPLPPPALSAPGISNSLYQSGLKCQAFMRILVNILSNLFFLLQVVSSLFSASLACSPPAPAHTPGRTATPSSYLCSSSSSASSGS